MTFCKLGTICLNLGPITNFFIPGNCSTISFLPAMNSAFTWTGAFVHGELSSQFLHTTHQSLFQVPSTRDTKTNDYKKMKGNKNVNPKPNTMHLLYIYPMLKLGNFQNFGHLANSENGQCLILFRLSSIWRWKFQKLQTCACCGNNSEDLWILFCWNSWCSTQGLLQRTKGGVAELLETQWSTPCCGGQFLGQKLRQWYVSEFLWFLCWQSHVLLFQVPAKDKIMHQSAIYLILFIKSVQKTNKQTNILSWTPDCYTENAQ